MITTIIGLIFFSILDNSSFLFTFDVVFNGFCMLCSMNFADVLYRNFFVLCIKCMDIKKGGSRTTKKEKTKEGMEIHTDLTGMGTNTASGGGQEPGSKKEKENENGETIL